MQQKLLSRAKFAQLAGVDRSTVTRLSKTVLLRACAGKKIDAAHPDAVKYLQHRDDAQTIQPVDLVYDDALAFCITSGRWSISGIQRELKIGYGRAKKIVDTMRINGLIPDESKPQQPQPKGGAAVKLKKTQAAQRRLAEEIENGSTITEIPEDIEAFADMTLREIYKRFATEGAFLDWLKATKEIENINEKRLKNAVTRGELISRVLVKNGIIEQVETTHIKLLTDGAKTMARRATAMHDAGRDVDEIETFIRDQMTSFIRPMKTKIARALRNA